VNFFGRKNCFYLSENARTMIRCRVYICECESSSYSRFLYLCFLLCIGNAVWNIPDKSKAQVDFCMRFDAGENIHIYILKAW